MLSNFFAVVVGRHHKFKTNCRELQNSVWLFQKIFIILELINSKTKYNAGNSTILWDHHQDVLFEGDLPSKAQELVTEWLKLHSEELQDMWNKQIIKKLPPL